MGSLPRHKVSQMISTLPDEFTEGPRHAVVTPDNNGAVLQIISSFLMVVTILATLLRLILRVKVAHAAGYDDGLACLALSLAIGEVVATSSGVKKGLGTRVRLLTDNQIIDVKKGVYVACILYILAIAAAKSSTLFFIKRLIASKFHRMIIRTFSVILVIWVITSVLTITFRCGVPQPWTSAEGECLDIISLSDAFSAIDIMIDTALIALPMVLVWNLHMQRHEKAIVSLAFFFRITAVGAQMARMLLLHKLGDSTDASYDSLAHNFAVQMHMASSILVASIPAYRPFMKRATSGMMSIRLGQGYGTYGVSGDIPLESLSKTSNQTRKRGDTSAQASKFIWKTIDVAVDSRTSPDERHLNPGRDTSMWEASHGL